MGHVQKERSSIKFWITKEKKLSRRQKGAKWYIQNVDDGIQKWVNLSTFCPNLTFKHRYITSKNGSIGRLFVTPPLSEIAKKLAKVLKYTPTFKVLSAPLAAMTNDV